MKIELRNLDETVFSDFETPFGIKTRLQIICKILFANKITFYAKKWELKLKKI